MTDILDSSTTENTKITWSVLFPRTLCNKLKNIFKAVQPELLKNNLLPEEGTEMQKLIVRILINKEYRIMDDYTDLTHTDKGRFSKYFTYFNDNSEINRYETVKQHILKEAKTGNYNFETFPFNIKLKENFFFILKILQQEDLNDTKNKSLNETKAEILKEMGTTVSILFDEVLMKKLDNLEAIPEIYKTNSYRAELANKDFVTKISCLTAIAATWHYWHHSKQDAADLAFFLLPPPEKNATSFENSWNIHIHTEAETATKLLNTIREDLFVKKDYFSAAENCSTFLKKYLNFANELEIGEVYYHLAICCADYGYQKYGKETYHYKDLLTKAVDYGYTDAKDRLYKETGKPYSVPLLRPISDTHGTAKIIFNTENVYSKEFQKTIPFALMDDNVITASTKKELEHAVEKNADCRFLLLDDSFEKNFQDLLYILDRILFFVNQTPTNDTIHISKLWSKTTIYIRTSEDKYAALIDTALKRLGNFTIRLFTIDDNKWSAQYLLNKHPLFKPIAFLTQEDLNNHNITIHFTIISQGNTELITWMIREAFYLGCFHYSGITLAINLISPDCNMIESQMRFQFPDMFGDIPDSALVSKVRPLHRLYQVESLSSPKLIEALDKLNEQPNTYHFYVIATGNDIENLNYGIKIREWSIQNLISSDKKIQKKSLPEIAFYCQNSDIAHLSKNMVVQTVDCGNLWYNNYNLIPFGMLCDRYSWDEIDGGYFEKVAQCTHLQYCQIKPSDSDETKLTHLKDYFSRCYNRDSSMAVALSLPYRLFQTAYNANDHILSEEQIPELLSTEMKQRNIEKMAMHFKTALADPEIGSENKKNLLHYEHSRWLRWAISRGWKKAEPQQVLDYMQAGNPKHQLYIARLHGCICSLEELELLAKQMCSYAETVSGSNWQRYAADRKALYIDTGVDKRLYAYAYEYTPKNFTEIDERNIANTAEMLTTAWFSDN